MRPHQFDIGRFQPFKFAVFQLLVYQNDISHLNVLPVLSVELPDELVDSRHQPRVAVLDINVDADIGEGSEIREP